MKQRDFFRYVKKYKDCYIGKRGPIQPLNYPFNNHLEYSRRIINKKSIRYSKHSKYINHVDIRGMAVVPYYSNGIKAINGGRCVSNAIKYMAWYSIRPISQYREPYYDSCGKSGPKGIPLFKQKRITNYTYYYIKQRG